MAYRLIRHMLVNPQSVEKLQEQALLKKGKKNKGPTAFTQRDLVAKAFAGDNVVQVSSSSSTILAHTHIYPSNLKKPSRPRSTPTPLKRSTPPSPAGAPGAAPASRSAQSPSS